MSSLLLSTRALAALVNHPSRTRSAVLMLGLAACILPLQAPAVTPAPDGGYPNANTAEGKDALFSETTGANNTAVGFDALRANTTGAGNTAVGAAALTGNVTAANNTAVGLNALAVTTADDNTATGAYALSANTKGTKNTANGVSALISNIGGSYNNAIGFGSLLVNKGGAGNTADGFSSLARNVSGDNNTALGYEALFQVTGNNNIGLGANAGQNLTTGNNNIDIGALGAAGESNTIRIGKANTQNDTFIQGIYNSAAANGVQVIVNSAGKLGIPVSSARYKEQIRPMDNASAAILALKPVTFRYKKDVDASGSPQFGLVAEQVEKVNPDLVVRDAEGKVLTVRYEAVNAMLLNEFLKEHGKVEAQDATIVELKKQVADLQAGLRKVSEQVATRDPATLASNNH